MANLIDNIYKLVYSKDLDRAIKDIFRKMKSFFNNKLEEVARSVNLISNNPNNWENGTIISGGDYQYITNRIITKDFYRLPEKSREYTLSVFHENVYQWEIDFFDNNKNHIGYVGWSSDKRKVITPAEQAEYIKIIIKRSNNSDLLPDLIGTDIRIKFELGDVEVPIWSQFPGDISSLENEVAWLSKRAVISTWGIENPYWFKIASVDALKNNDTVISFKVRLAVGNEYHLGILTAHVRHNSPNDCKLLWEIADDKICLDNFVLAVKCAGDKYHADIWVKIDKSYESWVFEVIEEGSMLYHDSMWELYTHYEGGEETEIPSGYERQISSTLMTLANPSSSVIIVKDVAEGLDWSVFDVLKFNEVFGTEWYGKPGIYCCRGNTADDKSGFLSSIGFKETYSVCIMIWYADSKGCNPIIRIADDSVKDIYICNYCPSDYYIKPGVPENLINHFVKIGSGNDEDDNPGILEKHLIADGFMDKFRQTFKGDANNGEYIAIGENATWNDIKGAPGWSVALALGVYDTNAYIVTNFQKREAFMGGGEKDKLGWLGSIAFKEDIGDGNITEVTETEINNMFNGTYK